MDHQPIINIGCLGSVSDGKSTMVNKLSGIVTQRHSSEKVRNITIKQGYANMKIWQEHIKSEYFTTDSNITTYETSVGDECKLVNHISLVDCPGHQELIKTMLASIKLMDGAVVIVGVDQPISKKPQLIQHLNAAKLGGLNKLIFCLNKIDLISKEVLYERKEELDKLLEEMEIKPTVIIPTCFNKKIGLKYLVKTIMEVFNPSIYEERTLQNPVFRISRTFDINKPGTDWNEIKGGVIGGTLFSGKLKVGDNIIIKPGILTKRKDGGYDYQPIKTKILSLKTESVNLDEIIPGGLVAIGTELDPYYCKNDNLIGNCIGIDNVCYQVDVKRGYADILTNDWVPMKNEVLMLQIGTNISESKLSDITKDVLTFDFVKPVCIQEDQDIIVCKNMNKILKIVGKGSIVKK